MRNPCEVSKKTSWKLRAEKLCTAPNPADASGKTESMSIFEPDKAPDGLLAINGSNYLKDDGE